MKNYKKLSKFLSLILKHKPEAIGIIIKEGGWVNIEDMLGRMKSHDKYFTKEDINKVVEENDKQSFTISENGKFIKVN